MSNVTNVTLSEIAKQINDKVAIGNSQIGKKALAANFMEGFKLPEKQYAEKAKDLAYDELFGHEKPMLAAAERLTFTVLKHTVLKYDGDIVSFDTTESKRFINFSEFCKRGKKNHDTINMDWEPLLAIFNQKLCVYRGDKLGISGVKDDYYLKKNAAELEYGNDLTFENLCDELQIVVNAYLGGETEYKVEARDVEFLLDGYTRIDARNALTISISSNAKLQNLVLRICHRIVTEANFSINGFKSKKQAEETQAKLKAARDEKKAKEEAEKAAAEVKTIAETPINFDDDAFATPLESTESYQVAV